jgi:hypothetical protein
MTRGMSAVMPLPRCVGSKQRHHRRHHQEVDRQHQDADHPERTLLGAQRQRQAGGQAQHHPAHRHPSGPAQSGQAGGMAVSSGRCAHAPIMREQPARSQAPTTTNLAVARPWPPPWFRARNGLPASLAGGTLHPPAPAVACWTGCHAPAGRVEGCSRPWRLAPAFGRPLDALGRCVAWRHRSPGAGEEQRPTSRHEARTVADQAGTPTLAGTC